MEPPGPYYNDRPVQPNGVPYRGGMEPPADYDTAMKSKTPAEVNNWKKISVKYTKYECVE